MNKASKSQQTPDAQLDDLRSQLENAQQTLHAIRHDEVDPLVISRPDGGQVYTLKGTLEPYRVMVELMGDGAVSLALDGSILYCNGRFAELVKIPREQIVGQALHRMIAAQNQDQFETMLARGRSAIVREELSLQAADGTLVPAHLSMCPLPDRVGQGIAAVITDLTALSAAVQAQLPQLESAETYRYFFDHSPVGQSISELSGAVHVNSALCQLLGYTEKDLNATRWQDLTHPDDIALTQKWIDLLLAGKVESARFSKRFLHKDGRVVWVDLTSALRRDPSGKPLYLMTHLADITEHRRSEQNLALEAKRLEASLTLSKMIDQSEQEILDFVLEQCIVLSESRYAFIGRIEADKSVMTVHAFSKNAVAQGAVLGAPPVLPLDEAGLWAEPIRQRRSVFINDCTATHANRRGTPAGHVEVKRYLGVPVFERGRIVMLIAVANKEEDYTQSDVDRLSSLATDAWRVIERQRAEHALVRSNWALRTLSEGNAALVRATDETALLDTMCQLIVKQGGYRMAWVGYADDNAERSITPMAWAGTELIELDALKLSWADTEHGSGPMSRAIRTGEPQLARDILSDPGFELWREKASADGFVSVFACPLRVGDAIIGAMGIYAVEADDFVAEELDLLKELIGDLAFGIETLRMRTERDHAVREQLLQAELLRHSLQDSIKAIADTVEMRDPYTAGHQRRVGQLAIAIARELDLPEHAIQGIGLAASIHDLGKISIPAEILTKPGTLTAIEFMLMKNHPQAGFDILKDIQFPWPIASMVLQHHERQDGSGYPQQLKGEQILFESRILAVADVVEAMATHRPYRAALGIDCALQEIERGRGTVYDAAVVDACLRLFAEQRFVLSS